jgi:hypothetical protein
MRLSVVAVSLILLFSQSTLAQHASGGGSGSGGGTSSGGSSSSAGSRGGGGSSGGSTHVSASSHVASGKIENLHLTGSGSAGEPAFYSNVHGESSEVHNQLLDQALAKLQYVIPANIKHDQPISAKSLRRIEPEESDDHKHCHHCKPTEHLTPGSNWRLSQDLYNTLQGDCGHLAA